MTEPTGPTFYYDFNSPYAYLAATRVDAVLGEGVRWQPVALAFVLRAHERIPWSMDERRDAGVVDCEQRARAYGLPAMRWPPGWPRESYTLDSLRAALVADDRGRLREFSRAAFAQNFVRGRGLDGDGLDAAAAEAGLDPAEVRAAIAAPEVKERLRAATESALEAGLVGVPTVAVGDELFWGDDRLEDAAAHAGGAGTA